MKNLRRALICGAIVIAVESFGGVPVQAAVEAEVVRERTVSPATLGEEQYAWTCGDLRLEANDGGAVISNEVTVTVNGVRTDHQTSVYRGVTATGSDGETYRVVASVSSKQSYVVDTFTPLAYRASLRFRFLRVPGVVETWSSVVQLEPWLEAERGSCRYLHP